MLPKISIVTPSFNQGQFLEQTIQSVLGQNYPNLEYIIVDGGSTDNSKEIIQKYQSQISYWVSEPDKGQSDAINKGFNRATGEILAWINSDDYYLPGALFFMASAIKEHGDGFYFGNCIHFRETADNAFKAWGSDVIGASQKYKLQSFDYVIQPSSFWTMDVWKRVGEVRSDLHFGFDWEWFLRAHAIGVKFVPLKKAWSMYRFHASHKTGSGGNKRREELSGIYKQYSPRYFELYSLLGKEHIKPLGRYWRYLRHFTRVLGTEKDVPELLKMIKFMKYSKYSKSEIRACSKML